MQKAYVDCGVRDNKAFENNGAQLTKREVAYSLSWKPREG